MPTKGKKIIKDNQKPFDFILCITVFILLALGIIMVLSASAPYSLSKYGNSYRYFINQLVFGVIGIGAMFFFSKLDYRVYKHLYKVAYVASIIVLLLVILPGIGSGAKGATRWVNLGFVSFQPSELAKIGLIIFYAGYLTEHRDEIGRLKEGFIKPLAWLIPPVAILFFFQDHLSASIIIICVVSIMMIMAGTKFRFFLSFGSLGAFLGAMGMLFLAKQGKGEFRLARLTTFLDPWQDATGDGWQVIQGLYAIGSGGFFGVGLGQSKQKYLYIPEPHNDFIFAVLAEELGFVGCAIVILLFAIFIWRGILIAMKAKDSFGSLLAVGITTLIGLQAIMNIAVVTSSMPATGISLPFFSYGGTALLILLSSVGILLNVSRSTSKV